MLFNSFEFIFVFLPIVFLGYFLINKISITVGKIWLIGSSLFFYSWWNPIYLPILLSSILVNYVIGMYILKQAKQKKVVFITGIVFNIALLGFFKYYDFFITNINWLFSSDFRLLYLALPLAISFFTFQQIAYLVDCYKGEVKVKDNRFFDYTLFVSFFPQLIAGPIVHHKEVMGQYLDPTKKKMAAENIAKGLFIFSIGLFKKVGIADTFAVWANNGYANVENLTLFDGWVTSLSYTFQLYFDFSGYSDMAIGLALLFNIQLPMNFNSPYKAVSIQDFWRRWHMTLSRFLTSYVYIPLGGNRISVPRTYVNIFIVFFISGLWHGAGWTFVIWGVLHGLAMILHRLWSNNGFSMNKILAWFITFQFVNATWVIFRAPDMATAWQVLKAMVGLNGVAIPVQLATAWNLAVETYAFVLAEDFWQMMIYLIVGLIVVLFMKNSVEMMNRLKPNPIFAVYAAALFVYSALHLQQVSEFLYFNF